MIRCEWGILALKPTIIAVEADDSVAGGFNPGTPETVGEYRSRYEHFMYSYNTLSQFPILTNLLEHFLASPEPPAVQDLCNVPTILALHLKTTTDEFEDLVL